MSEAITVLCPSCKASLKLKNRSAVGKRVPCPKCKKPFVVKAPAEEDDEMAFLNASESDAAMPVSDEDEEEAEVPAQPTPSTSRGSGSRKRKGKGKAAPPVNWLKPLLIGVTALVFVGLLVEGMFAVSFIGGMSKNKIDLSYLPPESELIAHARVDEMLASPFLQPLMAKPELKQALDKLTNELHVSLGDIKSMTLGVSGMSKVNYSKAFAIPGMPGMGMPGMGQPGAMPAQAMPNVQSEFSQTRTVVVIRTSNALPADLMTKLTGYESVTHQGTNYYRPAAVQLRSTQPALCLTTPNILLVADESEIQRIAEKGPKQVRRADFDFVETGPQFVIAMLNKSTGASGTPAGGAPAGGMPGSMPGGGMPGMPGGGMPGMPGGGMPGGGMGPGAGASGGLGGLANAASLTNGKIKGWYVGISFTQDIEIQTGLNCPESAKDALADIDRELTKAKNDFPSQKAQLGMLAMMGLGDLVPHIESMVNSLNATGTGDVVKVNLKIPGGIAATIEKAVPAIMGMAGAGAGGNPFGNPADGDTPADESSSETPTGDDPAASQNPPGNP